jgi:probable HAF family extracellular repeat protein
MRALKPLPGGNNSFATGTNNRMQTVGWAETGFHDPTCNTHHDSDQVLQFLPVVWGPGANQVRTLPLPAGDSDGAATAINDRGDVIGISGDCDQAVGRDSARHMVLWKNGKAIVLGNIGGDSWNTPMAINERGDIVGFALTAAGHLHAFYRGRADAAPTDMGVLYPGDTLSQALGINNRGQVVGISCGGNGCKGFVWQNGAMADLDGLAPGYPGTIIDAQDINDLGEITGQAEDAAGNLVSIIAIPIPSWNAPNR